MGIDDRTPPSAEEYAAFRERLSNWGRWGPDDELGALNHITPDKLREAAGCVRSGRQVSLGRPVDTMPSPLNPYPAHHFIAMPQADGALDYVGMFIHGFTQSHIDALCHLPTTDARTWNGKPFGSNRLPLQHSGTIDYWRSGIVTRGVLYDVPRFRGVDFVAPGAPVHGWELRDIATAQGVEARRGDAVMVRSGWAPWIRSLAEPPQIESVAGLHASCIEFLHTTEAAVLCWDMAEASIADQGIPNPYPHPRVALHVHHIVLTYMGVPIVDNLDLEELAAACSEVGHWDFQLVVAPLIITGATGSPVNPIAIL